MSDNTNNDSNNEFNFGDIDIPVDVALLGGEPVEQQTQTPAPEQTQEPAPVASVGAAPEAPKEPEKERSQQIPRERFDEVNTKLKDERAAREAAEAELTALRQQQQQAAQSKPEVSNDILDMERQAMAALMEGNDEKALELRSQINAAILLQAEERAESRVVKREQEQALSKQQQIFVDTAAAVVEKYPQLNSNAENNDPQAIADVIEWRDFYINKGVPSHEALLKASERVMGAAPEKKVEAAPDARMETAVKRNAESANSQPAAPVSGVGNRAAPIGSMPVKQDDWEKMPDAEREKYLS